MEWILLFIVICLSLFLQTGIIAAPLIIGGLLTLFVLFHKSSIIVIAFLIGIFADVLSFQTPGITSLFLLFLFAFVLLYERKFEIQTPQFVAAFTFISSLLYGILVQSSHIFLGALLTTTWSLFLFLLIAFLSVRLPAARRK